MKTNIHIPCPINEKDLCSDVLFDDLFDDNAYCCDGHGVLIGFVHRHVVKMSYIYGSNVVRFKVLDHPLSSDIKSRISQWLEIVRTGVNENSLDANTKLSTIAVYFNDIRSGNIIFEYNTDEK